ncbi:M20/M25/M40 family metallo-hydrolase [Heyndrickxia sp. MSNUG]|uniref:M20/M25/M40 family metallo-hydrolase n=1 Tax=Heyndrickxia sp. MSNUG TaxID=3136677 RepID=UPI003C2B2D0E
MKKEFEEKAIALFRELIKINTTNELCNEIEAAHYLRNQLEEEGIDSRIIYSPEGRGNLISKLNSETIQKKETLILLSHLDVVSAKEKEWLHSPFSGELTDGKIWGRGTLDTKQLTAMHLLAFINLNKYKNELNRDIYFIATADEENGSQEGMSFLSEEYPNIFKNAIVLSEGGGFTFRDQFGQEYMFYGSGEKGTARIRISAEGDGGHAGSPPENQAIFNLAEAVEALTNNSFFNEGDQIVTTFLSHISKEIESTPGSFVDQLYNYMKYPTIQVDSIDVGDKINVIPYLAEAMVEVRLLPNDSENDLEYLLEQILSPYQVKWEVEFFQSGYISDTDSEIIRCFKDKAKKLNYHGEFVPFTMFGKTDGRFISKIAQNIYGLSPLLTPFTEVLKRVHNKDECVELDSYLFGVELMSDVLNQFCKSNGGE